MARKPDVFVRAVTSEEGRKLAQVARRSKQPVRMRRAIVVMASAQRQPVPKIAKFIQVSESYVRPVVHDFNEKSMDALDPKWSAGRPAKTDQSRRDRICSIARCCPRDLGWPFSTWSLSKLVEVLRHTCTATRPSMGAWSVSTSSDRSTCSRVPVAAGTLPGARNGCGPPITAPRACGTCSVRWICRPGSCTTASVTGNAGWSSCRSSSPCVAGGQARSCI